MPLIQYVSQPTQHRIGQMSSILDLIFIFDPYSVNNIIHSVPLGHNDHKSLQWTICLL